MHRISFIFSFLGPSIRERRSQAGLASEYALDMPYRWASPKSHVDVSRAQRNHALVIDEDLSDIAVRGVCLE